MRDERRTSQHINGERSYNPSNMVEFEEITESTNTEPKDSPGNTDTTGEATCATERIATIEAKREPSASGAARLRALRKKRFKQKQEDAVDISKDNAVDDVVSKGVKLSASVMTVDRDGAKSSVDQSSVVSPVQEPVSSSQPSSETKKYQGVAAVRRKKVLEKRQKDQEEAEKSEKYAQQMIENMKLSSKTNSAPYYELLVLVILFVCGFFIGGLQQESFLVKSGFHYLSPSDNGRKVESISSFQEEHGVADEFDEFRSFGDDQGAEGEIDPIFRIDLDKFTQGDSIFMSVARFAVGIHRTIIYFPSKIVTNPPVLLLVALMLRKIIPTPKIIEEKPAADNMTANALNFISSFFPGLVSVYDTYKRTRLDVYVIFTGFLLGIIMKSNTSIYASNDEL